VSVEALTVRAVDARLIRVPMRRPLHTSAARVTHAPLVLLDLHTDQGVTGRAYLFCYLEALGRAVVGLARDTAPLLVGRSGQPGAVRRTLTSAFRLAGVGGPTAMLLSGLDMACWDALALAAELPLVRLLGAEPRPWLEYVDWANPILREPLDVSTGTATPSERAGVGLEWDEDAVARYRAA